MKRSTGLRNHMLVGGSLKDALDGTVIKIYSGAPPASADAAIGSAVLLCVVTVDGDGTTGLTLASTATGGQVTKNPSELWEGEVVANGTASFFRQETLADDGSASTTAIRLQGSIGNVGEDMNFSDTLFSIGDTRRINFYVAAIPAG